MLHLTEFNLKNMHYFKDKLKAKLNYFLDSNKGII